MYVPSPALVEAALAVRERAARELGAPCTLSLWAGGASVCVHPDGGVTAIPAQGGAQVLRPGRGPGSADVRTATHGG